MKKLLSLAEFVGEGGGNKMNFFHSSQFIFMGVKSSSYFSVEFTLIMKRGFLHEYDIQ